MSDDILSGGAIDPSTSGPIPPSEDDRSRDILSEQKGRQDQDAIGGTQLPPRPQPPPEIQEIAPPLPPIDFNISGLDLEGTKEIARQTVVDVLKNVTINGQGPSVDGSSIAFNVSQEQSASESFGNIAQAARNAARQSGADIGFDDAQTARDAARQGGADISFNDAQAARDAARQKGADIDSDDAQAARDEAREERSSARAYKAAEEERRERKESDPNFDRESYVRQKGETPTEFRERQEQLRQERVERAQREDLLIRIRTGDFTEMPSGIIPVRLTRADGNKKILALMATDFVGVVEGASELDRPATLPSEDSYYEAGGESSPSHPWKITIRTVPESDPPEYEYAIESASRLFNGFGGIAVDVAGADGVFRPVEEGFYFIEVEFTDGEIDQAEIKITEDMGASVETEGGKQKKLKQQIGYVYFEDEVPKIRQYAWHNYSLFDVCRDGGPVKITIAT